MIKRFNEYYSNNEIKFMEFMESMERFQISKQDYTFIFLDDEGNIAKDWLSLNDKEKSIIVDYTIPYYPYKNVDNNIANQYILYSTDDYYVDLIKMTDDYYYVNIMTSIINKLSSYEGMNYYKLDQLSELKYFIRQLNIFKKTL